MIPRAGSAAVLWCRTHRTWPVGYCLRYVRSAHGIPGLWPSAALAWDHAEGKHRGDPTPPPGVPVFFSGGRYGHVAMSAGGGYCWSTDAVTPGQVSKVRIADLAARWRYPYLGWAEVYNGIRVWSPPVVDQSAIAAATRMRTVVDQGLRVKRALAAEVGRGRMSLGDARLGWRFKRRYRRWQRRCGYSGATLTGIPDLGSLTELGKRHGFDVRP